MNTTGRTWYTIVILLVSAAALAALTLLTGCGRSATLVISDKDDDQARIQHAMLDEAWTGITYTERISICAAFYTDPRGNFDQFFAPTHPTLEYSTWKDWFTETCARIS